MPRYLVHGIKLNTDHLEASIEPSITFRNSVVNLSLHNVCYSDLQRIEIMILYLKNVLIGNVYRLIYFRIRHFPLYLPVFFAIMYWKSGGKFVRMKPFCRLPIFPAAFLTSSAVILFLSKQAKSNSIFALLNP